jgi:hypothetical protein
MVRLPLFEHKTLGFHFCYLPNNFFRWNQFKGENLDDSNYDSSCGGGDFSHAYVIMHQYFGKKFKMQKNEYMNFYKQLDLFFRMNIFYM